MGHGGELLGGGREAARRMTRRSLQDKDTAFLQPAETRCKPDREAVTGKAGRHGRAGGAAGAGSEVAVLPPALHAEPELIEVVAVPCRQRRQRRRRQVAVRRLPHRVGRRKVARQAAAGAVGGPQRRRVDAAQDGLQVPGQARAHGADVVVHRAAVQVHEEGRLRQPMKVPHPRAQLRGVEGPVVEGDGRGIGAQVAAGHSPGADGAGNGVADEGPAEEVGVKSGGGAARHL